MFGRAIRGSSHAGASNRIQELRKTQRPVGAPSLSLRVTYEALFSRYRDLANALGEIGRSITATINRTALSRQDLAKSADTFAAWPLVRKSALPPDKLMIPFAHHKIPAASRSIGQYTNFSRTTLSFDHS
jgi:hypothetical protein